MRLIPALIGLVSVSLSAGPLFAQTLNPSPLLVDQGRIDRADAKGRSARPPQRKHDGGETDKPIAQAEFPIASIGVEGATALSDTAALTRPFLGQQSSVPVLTKLASTIAQAYKKKDVAFYTVEIAGMDAGTRHVTVRVLEGYLTDIAIAGRVGARWQHRVRRLLAPLLSQRPLRRSDYERALVRANAVAGLDTEASLAASDRPGGVVLHMTLRRQKAALAASFHNFGNELVGADTVEAAAQATGLATTGDEATLYYSSPTNFHRSHYLSAAYTLPVDRAGTAVRLNAGWLRTRLLYDLLRGSAVQGGVTVSRPLLQRFGRVVTVAAGFDFIDVENALLGYRLTDDHTRAMRASLHYMEESARHRLDANITLSRGLDIFGARTIAPLAQAGFTKINLRVDYARQIAARTLVRAKGIAQLSSARLPAVEQIAAGGAEFGRGLSSGLIAGDRGWAANVEIAQQPDMPRLLTGSEFYLFADGAALRYRDRGPFAGTSYRSLSVGGGIRLKLAERASVDMSGATILRAPYTGLADTWRLMLSARVTLGP